MAIDSGTSTPTLNEGAATPPLIEAIEIIEKIATGCVLLKEGVQETCDVLTSRLRSVETRIDSVEGAEESVTRLETRLDAVQDDTKKNHKETQDSIDRLSASMERLEADAARRQKRTDANLQAIIEMLAQMPELKPRVPFPTDEEEADAAAAEAVASFAADPEKGRATMKAVILDIGISKWRKSFAPLFAHAPKY